MREALTPKEKGMLLKIFEVHIDAAFKLTRPLKKKNVIGKAFLWLEILIREAPIEFYQNVFAGRLLTAN